VFRREARNDAVSCLVLTGKGDYFSSGADLTDNSWTPSEFLCDAKRRSDLGMNSRLWRAKG
jgi:enoyl-CoA hydratase/carnithine racemase